MAIETPLVIQQGAILQKLITVTNVATGLPFDLTNFNARGQVRDLRKNLIVELDCSVYNALTGKILAVISAVDTALITSTKAMRYTVEIAHKTDPDTVYRVAEGDVTLSLEYCIPIPVIP